MSVRWMPAMASVPRSVGQPEELLAVRARVGGHTAEPALLEEVGLVVQGRDVGEVDAGDGERAEIGRPAGGTPRRPRACWRSHCGAGAPGRGRPGSSGPGCR